MTDLAPTYTAFLADRRLAAGSREIIVNALRSLPADAMPLVFDDVTGRAADFDLRETPEPNPAPRGPGRPRLGVTAREVTLLPRHWDWLGTQPGGASAALRRLVEAARREAAGPDRRRAARDAAYAFASAMAGDAPGFEEASRALFVGDRTAFEGAAAGWPEDVAAHARGMAAGWWETV